MKQEMKNGRKMENGGTEQVLGLNGQAARRQDGRSSRKGRDKEDKKRKGNKNTSKRKKEVWKDKMNEKASHASEDD